MMGEMDHSDVRAMLEDAAIEPQGLERIMAGDTPAAAQVAGHLAACPDCSEELARLHRVAGLIRPVVRSMAPPELRERTLAYVAAVGRPRGSAAAAAPETGAIRSSPADEQKVAAEPERRTPVSLASSTLRRRRPTLGPLVGLAAALIVAVAGTGLVVSSASSDAARRQAVEIEALGDVARWTLRVDAQPDVRRVALDSTTGSATAGTLVFSPSSRELVVVADDLAPAPAGHEYRCWIEIDGSRRPIGRMFFGGDLAYWVGGVDEVAGVPPGARFGVSLVDLARSGEPGEPVLVGVG
jgi:hypothetical protein